MQPATKGSEDDANTEPERGNQAEKTIEVARHGRSYAAVQVCQCEDGQYRHALYFWGSLRGFCGSIKRDCPGYASLKAASDAGREEMLREFPTPQAYDPEKECRELFAMREQIAARVRQPSLFRSVAFARSKFKRYQEMQKAPQRVPFVSDAVWEVEDPLRPKTTADRISTLRV